MTTLKAALIVSLIAAAACRPHSNPQVEPKPATVGWRPVETFSGRGSTQTQSFDIGVGQWRIKWEAQNESPPGTGTLEVTVHSAVSGRPLELVVNHRGTGHGIAYVNEDPRLFHLVIDSNNVDWTVAIEEAVVGAAETGKP
ncbi:MAG TPA: hypothetical protein VLY24_16335 [Bryobacteraceae bacterium]|nr:hypothetical protein [Bryobacteraceae bacterium]